MDQRKIDLNSISTLVPLAKNGDRDAQNEILEQIQDVVLNMARQHFGPDLKQRQNPSDVVQLTMARVINGFEDFRGTSEKEFFGWLRAILQNEIHLVRRHQHQAKRDVAREIAPSDRDPNRYMGVDQNLTPSSNAIKQEKIELLQKAMSRLPADSALVIQLRNLDELSFHEIALKMNRSYNAVAKLWQRSVVQLEHELEKLEIE